MAKKENTTETVETVDIIRGRMPLPMVHLIRFGEAADTTDGALAKKYRTTPGKINDIRKSRNFGYIVEEDKFTKEQIDAAIARAEQLGEDADGVVEALNAYEVATEADVEAMEKRRAGSRKPRGKDKDDEPAGSGEPEGNEPEESDPEAGDEGQEDLADLLD